jgi:soluble lytic murein transglycosylase-like protein
VRHPRTSPVVERSPVRRIRTLVVGVALLGLASTAVSAAHEVGDAEAEVDDLEQEFTETVRSLEELGAAIDRAERALLAAQRRLNEANQALAGLEEEIEAAEAARDRAEREHQRAIAVVEEAEAEVAAAYERQHEADGRLHRRAIEVYKYGAGLPQQTLVTGVVGASDWHEVAVTAQSVARIVGNDRELLDIAQALRAEALLAEEQAELYRHQAAEAEQHAVQEAEELQVLVDEQLAAVEAVEQERRRRAAILRSFEQDKALMAELASRLESEIATARANAERLRQEAAEAERAADDSDDPPAEAPTDLSWAAKLPASGQPWAETIADAALANGVDPRLMAALVWSESGFNPNAVSHAGAIGLAQLMPGTAAWLGVDPWDPHQNLDGGARYLNMRITQFGSVELGLAAYNAGATRVQEAGPGIPNIAETQFYVYIVMQRYNHLAS